LIEVADPSSLVPTGRDGGRARQSGYSDVASTHRRLYKISCHHFRLNKSLCSAWALWYINLKALYFGILISRDCQKNVVVFKHFFSTITYAAILLLGVFKPGALNPVTPAPIKALPCLCISPPMAEKSTPPALRVVGVPEHYYGKR